MLSRKFWLGASIWDPASLVAQTVKRLPAVQETWVQSLGWENPLEKEMATYCSILAWKIPRTEEPGRLQSMGSQSRTQLSDFSFSFQCSCLENPRDWGAWWAAVYGVAQSWT